MKHPIPADPEFHRQREREMVQQEKSKELIRRFPESWPLHLIGVRPVIG